MKCVEQFHSEESACQCRDRLHAKGIKTQIVVDPLACRYPALSDIQEVAILVSENDFEKAKAYLSKSYKEAG